MLKALLKSVVFWLNAFASNDGVSDTLSPANIVQGTHKPDFNTPRLPFGTYAMVYSGTSNNMKKRGGAGISLAASNEQGGHYFMNIITGKRFHGYHWEVLPITDAVITQVEGLAKKEKRKKLIKGMPLFEWAPGHEVIDLNDYGDEINDTLEDEEEVLL